MKYDINGLKFWTEEQISLRDGFVPTIYHHLKTHLLSKNSAFQFVRVEAPCLTPKELIQYAPNDYFTVTDTLALRPETTMGSYIAAEQLLNPHSGIKYRLPLVVWQHGKSFRNEQDKTEKNMRLKEFYQLEFQIIFSESTKADYYEGIVEAVRTVIMHVTGVVPKVLPSDRLPYYSEVTMDVEVNGMEICSISKRKDFQYPVIEVAIGTDRLVYQKSEL